MIRTTHLVRSGPVFLCNPQNNERQHSEAIEEPGCEAEEINQLEDLTHENH